MRDILERAVLFVLDWLRKHPDLVFWGLIGSTIATLFAVKKDTAPKPIWLYLFMIVVGLACAIVFGPKFATTFSLEIAAGGFICGLCGYGLSGWLYANISDPIALYKKIKNAKEDE